MQSFEEDMAWGAVALVNYVNINVNNYQKHQPGERFHDN